MKSWAERVSAAGGGRSAPGRQKIAEERGDAVRASGEGIHSSSSFPGIRGASPGGWQKDGTEPVLERMEDRFTTGRG